MKSFLFWKTGQHSDIHKMALNIAVPLSGVSDFIEGFGLLSPISPISVDCREHLKLLVSPIGSESSGISSLDSEECKEKISPVKQEEELKINYNGRDLLDLHGNLSDDKWKLQYAVLPLRNNVQMFFANRSQYHRLGDSGLIQEYSMIKCQCCDFHYPVNNYSISIPGANNINVTATATTVAANPISPPSSRIVGHQNHQQFYQQNNYNRSYGLYRQF